MESRFATDPGTGTTNQLVFPQSRQVLGRRLLGNKGEYGQA